MSVVPLRLLVIGTDSRLLHLFRRYAEQGRCELVERVTAPESASLRLDQPAALVFLSLELLQQAQTLVDDLAARETPVLVCASVADEARARELGADACLLHPLTYERFLEVLTAVRPPQTH